MRALVILAGLLVPVVALSTERPFGGIVYNVKDPQALTYECSQSGVEMTCSFTQSAVSRKAKPDELASALQRGKTEFATWVRQAAKECPGIETMGAVLSGRQAPPDQAKFLEGMRNMTPTQKADLERSVASLLSACRDRTESSYLAFIRHTHDISTRTCRVWTSNFTQRFRRVGGAGPWVVVDSPTGACGTVNVSRFENEAISGGLFWRYFSKKVVTNKSGELMPGFACSALDENEYLFDWRSIERQMGCDYISFGPL